MNRARILYHMVRADFMERVRRYSFLLTLGCAVYLGYLAYSGTIVLHLGDRRGIYNSAWLGGLMGLVASSFLTLIGFYVVKNAVQRDRETRVGQVLATTPMSRTFYTAAKAISNFAVLASMVLVMALAALLMQLLRAEDPHLDLWALLSPLLLLALPAVAFTAALAVLFETLPVLRGGLGNVLWFFVWGALLSAGIPALDGGRPMTAAGYLADLSGIATVMSQMQSVLRNIDPLYTGGAALNIGAPPPTRRFLWTGLEWSSTLVLCRLAWMVLAAAVALLASRFFHRFDPAWERRRASTGKAPPPDAEEPAAAGPPELRQPPGRLTPLLRTGTKIRLIHLTAAELRLMLKGRRWWWWLTAAGLSVACLAAPLDVARRGLLVAARIWPVLLWSQMGAREARHATQSLIFSSAGSLRRQLPAVWLAGVALAILTGGGMGLHFLIAGDTPALAAWFAGALFIPSLALALGVWSGSGKLFEAIYTAWWYAGPLNHIPGLDFMGTTPASSDAGIYLLAAGLLVAGSYVGRRARLAYA